MKKKFTAQQIPELINNYNVYDGDGDRLIGLTDTTSMAELVAKTVTVSGAGMLGEYAAVVLGHFTSITQTLNFRILYGNALSLFAPGKDVSLSVRGAIQYDDAGAGTTDLIGVRYVLSGKAKQLTIGDMKAGDAQNASVQIEVTRILIELDGEVVLELDKKNMVYKVDGVDYAEKLRRLC